MSLEADIAAVTMSETLNAQICTRFRPDMQTVKRNCLEMKSANSCGTGKPVSVAQWVKPLLIGRSACWPDELNTPEDPGSKPT